MVAQHEEKLVWKQAEGSQVSRVTPWITYRDSTMVAVLAQGISFTVLAHGISFTVLAQGIYFTVKAQGIYFTAITMQHSRTDPRFSSRWADRVGK